ncbi:MAG: peptidylprolyl isomerase, partial [Actinomycetota bacterium]
DCLRVLLERTRPVAGPQERSGVGNAGDVIVGAVAMANAGPDTNGSQFFVCIDDCRRKLAPSYNLFGYVVEGMDVALAVRVGDVMRTVVIEAVDRV